MRKDLPEINLLKQYISFCPDSGKLFYKEKTPAVDPRKRERTIFNTQFSGKEAFCNKNAHGYLVGSINGRRFSAHRIIWALHYGEWPSKNVDHINGDTTDNRIGNLRDVTQKDNLRNMKKSAANKSGHTGVFWSKNAKKWTSQIWQDGKALHLGYFETIEEAVKARKDSNMSFGYHPNHGER